MCAPSERQSWLGGRKPSRGLARPLQALGVVPCRGKSLSRSLQAGEPLQAWRDWSLVKFFWRYDGPWQAGPWYPGFHCADNYHHNINHNGSSLLNAIKVKCASSSRYLPFFAVSRLSSLFCNQYILFSFSAVESVGTVDYY